MQGWCEEDSILHWVITQTEQLYLLLILIIFDPNIRSTVQQSFTKHQLQILKYFKYLNILKNQASR